MKINKKLKYIYFIQCEELIKIGITKNIDKRMKQLKTGNGKDMKLVYYVIGEQSTEWYLHNLFKSYHVRGEWYKAIPILNWIDRDKLTRKVLSEELNKNN